MIRRILSYVGSHAWAIEERSFEMWRDIFLSKLEGGNIGDITLYDMKEQSEEETASAKDKGTAIIPIHGTLLSRNAVFSSGRSYSSIREDIQAALNDDSVSNILLDIDSPGGSVSGLYSLGEFIKEANKQKPIVSYSDGMVASAAYWIASATSKIVVSPTADIGSIGVLSMHTDASKFDEKIGIKRTYIYSGKYKAMGNSAEPLNSESKKYIQGLLDKAYSVFLEEVSENRSLSMDNYESWAEGRVFIAKDALSLGLIDGIGTMDVLYSGSEIETFDKAAAAVVPSIEEGTVTTKDLTEEMMTFDPKKYEGDAAFQKYTEGIEAKVKAESQAKVEALQAQLSGAENNNKELEERVMRLEAKAEKEAALRIEAALKAQADEIFDHKMSNSNVPEKLHGKVRKQLNHSDFVAEGALDQDGWANAVAEELKDWEAVYEDKSLVLGSSSSKKAIADSNDNDILDKEADTLINLLGPTQ